MLARKGQGQIITGKFFEFAAHKRAILGSLQLLSAYFFETAKNYKFVKMGKNID